MAAFLKRHVCMHAQPALWLMERFSLNQKLESGEITPGDIEAGDLRPPFDPRQSTEEIGKCQVIGHKALIPLTAPLALVIALLVFVLALSIFLVTVLGSCILCLLLCCSPRLSGFGPELFDKSTGFLGTCLLTVLGALLVAGYSLFLFVAWPVLLIMSIFCHPK